jgi:hypothetical protein
VDLCCREDQARRGHGIERGECIVAVEGVDTQAGQREHRAEIIDRNPGHPLDELESALTLARLWDDSLVDGAGVAPSRDAVVDTLTSKALLAHQARLRVRDIQVVEDEAPARLQRARHVVHDTEVVAGMFEVPEAGEQAEHVVVDAGSERPAHVLTDPTHAPARTSPGDGQALGRQVQTVDVKTARGEMGGVTAVAATEVENRSVPGHRQSLNQGVDEGVRFLFVTMGIEALIVGRVEPRDKPFRFDRVLLDGCGRLHVVLSARRKRAS